MLTHLVRAQVLDGAGEAHAPAGRHGHVLNNIRELRLLHHWNNINHHWATTFNTSITYSIADISKSN